MLACQRKPGTGGSEMSEEQFNKLKRMIRAFPYLRELAKEVAKEYPDAADWKDARGRLASMAHEALEKLK